MAGRRDDRDAGTRTRAIGDPPNPLFEALERLRRDPILFVPFTAVGLLLGAIDGLRRRDPIPAIEYEGIGTNGIGVHLEFAGYPTAVARTTRPYESLVALEPGFLVWGLGLQLLSLLAIGVAGAVTMARATERELRPGAIAAVVGFVVAMDLGHRLLGSIDALQGMGLLGFVPLAIYLLVMVRLFPVPGLLVAGRSPRAALGRSRRLVAGRGWTILGAIVAIGLSAWLLASVPYGPVGPVLTGALVAPVHAVAIAAVCDRRRVAE